MTSCSHYFHNATKLTLSDSFHESRKWLAAILKRIIPLQQLTTLVIDHEDFSFEQLIRLLNSTSNIQTLSLSCQSISESNSRLIQQSEMFRLVSSRNIITNVIVKENDSVENRKLLVSLCLRMQYFTIIDRYTQNHQSSVQFVLSKTKTSLMYLCLLCIKNTVKPMVGTLKILIESEELLDNYLMKLIGSDLYIWW